MNQLVEVMRPLPEAAAAVKKLAPVTVTHNRAKAPVAKRVEAIPEQTAKVSAKAMGQLRQVLDASCLRFDMLALAEVLRSHADDATFRREAGERSNQRIAACIEELGAVDTALARGLSRDAEVVLEGLVDVEVATPDPCLTPGPAGGHTPHVQGPGELRSAAGNDRAG